MAWSLRPRLIGGKDMLDRPVSGMRIDDIAAHLSRVALAFGCPPDKAAKVVGKDSPRAYCFWVVEEASDALFT
jgi:hypothetical protein